MSSYDDYWINRAAEKVKQYLHYKDYVANLKNLYCKEVTK